MRGAYQDLTTPWRRTDACYECGEKFKKSDTLKSGRKVILDIVNNPWAAEPRTIAVHANNDDDDDGQGSCLDKLTDTSWSNFRLFTCGNCGRLVSRQCNSDGHRSYVKIVNGEEICVACYHKDVLQNGMSVDFSDGIPGDFFNPADIEAYGWEPVNHIQNYHVKHPTTIDQVKKTAADLAAKERLILIDYDDMATTYTEGFISMFSKPRA